MAAPSLSAFSSSLRSEGGSRLSSSSIGISPTTSLATEGLTPITPSGFSSELHSAAAAATAAAGNGGGDGGTAAGNSAFSRALSITPHTFSDDPFFFGIFEKLPLVFDIGDAIVKAGYGGEREPACLLRMRRQRPQQLPSSWSTENSLSSSNAAATSSSSSTTTTTSSSSTIKNPPGKGDSSSSNTGSSRSNTGNRTHNNSSIEARMGGEKQRRTQTLSILEKEEESPYINAEEALVAAGPSYPPLLSPPGARSYLLYTTAETSFRITRRRIQRLLHYLIFKGLRVSPRDRAVIICEALLHAEQEKHALVDVLFRDYDVAAVSFIPAVVSPLYCCGVDFGLVVDVGLEETRIMATACGSMVLQSLVCCRLGGAAVDRELRRLLLLHAADDPLQRQTVEALSSEQLENCKIQCCYVRYSLPQQQQQQEKVQQRQQGEKQEQQEGKQQDNGRSKESRRVLFEFKSDNDVFYRAAADKLLRVTADLRWKPCEVFFGPCEDSSACGSPLLLHEAIVESLVRCPREIRVLAAQNIVLCGGSIQLRGMTTRLAVELDGLLAASANGLQRLRPLVKFGVPAYAPLLRSWTGASMHAALEGRSEYTREQFLKKTPISDWTSWVLQEGVKEDAAERKENSSSSNSHSSSNNGSKGVLHAAGREIGRAPAAAGVGGEKKGGKGSDSGPTSGEGKKEEAPSYKVSNYVYECGFD